jgi:hypothetical protein
VEGQAAFSQAMRVYPNPAASAMTLVTSGELFDSYEVISSTGTLCVSGRFEAEQTSVSVTDLAPGLYMVLARNKDGEIIATTPVVISGE